MGGYVISKDKKNSEIEQKYFTTHPESFTTIGSYSVNNERNNSVFEIIQYYI